MRLERLVVRNAKALTKLDASFERGGRRKQANLIPAVDLICAPNGQGKTTLLEVISLVGHLPCAQRVTFEKGTAVARPSWADQHWDGEALDTPTPFDIKPDAAARLDEWVLTLSSEWLGAYFEVEDLDDQIGTVKFCVILAVEEQSLTSLLSARMTDRQFARWAYLVGERGGERKLNAFVEAIARGRTFNPPIAVPQDGPRRFISYINTDMNDFGRGNDLRESPKTLTEDFRTQMVDRIGVPFDRSPSMNGVLMLRDFKKIKTVLQRVLTTPRYRFSTADVVSPSLELTEFHIVEDQLQVKAHLRERRGAPRRSDPLIENLSAGENETLFVFLMLLRMQNEPSLVLLDEPDLHVAGYMRPTLFQILFEHFNEARQHLIIVSHSQAAVTALRRFRFRSASANGLVKLRGKEHLHVLLKVHPKESRESEFKLVYDRGFLRTLKSGLLTGSVTWGGRLGLALEELAGAHARVVSEMQKSNWAWYPFVGSAMSLAGFLIVWMLVSVVAPPEDVNDRLHVDLVTWLVRGMILAFFAFVPTFVFGSLKAILSKLEDE